MPSRFNQFDHTARETFSDTPESPELFKLWLQLTRMATKNYDKYFFSTKFPEKRSRDRKNDFGSTMLLLLLLLFPLIFVGLASVVIQP